jgi:ABC-type uncharacterized transport system auxiliary subunit
MKTRTLLLALALAAAGQGCAHAPARHYYSLNYPLPAPALAAPHPFTLRVKDLSVSPAYAGDAMVVRQDVNEIEYYQDRRWTDRPQRMVSDAIRKHLRAAGLAQQVTERLTDKAPDFSLEGTLDAIEELDAGDESFAHLAFSLQLVRASDGQVVWRRAFDERRRVAGQKGRSVVRALSELLEQQMGAVVSGLDAAFARGGAPEAAPEPARAAPAPAPRPPGIIAPDPRSPLLAHPQLADDDTAMPAGRGAIFLPALSESMREPPVEVLAQGKVVAEGRMGERVIAPPGLCEVRFGSGVGAQQQSVQVLVEEGRVTAVPPSWAALEVRVVNDHFIAFRGRYEIISVAEREEYGLGFGADEEQGEEVKVWLLKPGLYKLVRAGGTYRDRINFATVQLEPGKLTHFALVQDPDTEDFKGAGVLDGIEAVPADGPWKKQVIIGGDLKAGHNDQTDAKGGWNFDLSVFLDALARYRREPHLFVARLEVEEGQLRTAGQRRFTANVDRLYFHGIYTFHVLPWLGPYLRAGLETKLLPRYAVYDSPRDIEHLDAGGNAAEMLHTDLVPLGGPFAPLQLKEGMGGNLRALHTSVLDLDVRLGVGGRQYYPFGERAIVTSDGTDKVRDVSGYRLTGLEGAVVGQARLSRWIALSTELDGLVPFWDAPHTVLTWRSQASLRLVSFASVNYLFNLTRDPNRNAGKTVLVEQLVQLRFSYGLL